MRLSWLYWLAIVFWIWLALDDSVRAVRAPWTWNSHQIVLAVFLALIFAVCAHVAFDLMRYGAEATRTRWRTFVAASVEASRNLSLWIVVALVLVAYFNMTQH